MYHLVDNLQTKAGDALGGYYVKLKDGSGTYATLYSDANSTPIATVSGVADTALTDDETGQFDLYVDDGSYTVEFYDKNDINTLVRSIPAVPMFTQGAAGSIAYQRSATASSRTQESKNFDRADIRDWIGGSWSSSNDYTTEIQNAINELHNLNNASYSGGATLVLPSGVICASNLTMKRVTIEGAGSNASILKYIGAGGDTFITATYANMGMRRVALFATDALRPATMLDITAASDAAQTVDYQTILDEVYFGQCSGSSLKLPNITNATLIRPRWDNAARMIEVTNTGGSSGNRHILIVGGTIDWANQQTYGSGNNVKVQELFKLNNSTNDEINLSWFGGRIEGRTDTLADTFSFMRITGNSQANHGATLSLHKGGFVATGSITTQVPGYINIDSTQTTLAPTLELRGFRNNLFGTAYIGTLGAYAHNPTLATQQPVDALVDANQTAGTRIHQYPRDAFFGEYSVLAVMSGNTCVGFSFTHPTSAGFVTTTSSPEGVITANPGTLCFRNATAGFQTYRKVSGTGNTGWQNVTNGVTATAANIADKTNALNATSGEKWQGRQVYDTTNHRLMIADGTADVSAWYVADGSASVTPA